MKMKELKMYEAPKMEVVEVEMECQLMAGSLNDTNASNSKSEGLEEGEW